jgi:hypothetical protein
MNISENPSIPSNLKHIFKSTNRIKIIPTMSISSVMKNEKELEPNSTIVR